MSAKDALSWTRVGKVGITTFAGSGGGPAKAMALPEGMSSANSSGASGAELGPAKARDRPSAFFRAAAGSLRTEVRRDTMSVHWNALLLSFGSGMASLRCRPLIFRVVAGPALAAVIALESA